MSRARPSAFRSAKTEVISKIIGSNGPKIGQYHRDPARGVTFLATAATRQGPERVSDCPEVVPGAGGQPSAITAPLTASRDAFGVRMSDGHPAGELKDQFGAVDRQLLCHGAGWPACRKSGQQRRDITDPRRGSGWGSRVLDSTAQT